MLFGPALRDLADCRREEFAGPLVGLVAGHVAVGCAVPAEVAAQEEVVIGGRIAVRLQGGLPGDEVVSQEGVDRWSA